MTTMVSGGETGIRTLGARKGTTVFETAPFDRSGTSPLPRRHSAKCRNRNSMPDRAAANGPAEFIKLSRFHRKVTTHCHQRLAKNDSRTNEKASLIVSSLRFTRFGAAAVSVTAIAAGAAAARDQIHIVGSSTVLPCAQSAAAQISGMTGALSPVVESTGGGMKLFCAGFGERHPDITGASRAMKASECELCRSNG